MTLDDFPSYPRIISSSRPANLLVISQFHSSFEKVLSWFLFFWSSKTGPLQFQKKRTNFGGVLLILHITTAHFEFQFH